MAMGAEGTRVSGASSLPKGLRARTRAARVVADDTYDEAACTPPMLPTVTVPFLWEEAPGRPKTRRNTAAGTAPAAVVDPVARDGGATAAATDGNGAKVRPVPLKLPPRLQVPSSKADYPHSPRTVTRGPYGCAGGKRPPRALTRRSGGVTTFRRTSSSAGEAFFSWRKATAAALGSKKKYGHDHDASSCSPSASSSSSSSSSLYCLVGDHGHGSPRQQADGRDDLEGPVAAEGGVTAAATNGGDHDGGSAGARSVLEDGNVTAVAAAIDGGSAGARHVPEDGAVTAPDIDGRDHDGGSARVRTITEHGGVTATATGGGDQDGGRARTRPVSEQGGVTAVAAAIDGGSAGAGHVPLKLPPRLHVTSMAERSLSPKTVLQGPTGFPAAKKSPRTLRRSWSMATFRMTPSAGGSGGFFTRRSATAATWANKKGGNDHDTSCCSPSASASSSSKSCFVDDHGHGPHRPPADGCGGSEEDEGAKWPVRITRFRRNKSLPTLTTSHLWASLRKSVKQITPWS